MIVIDGNAYVEKSVDEFPFGNACNHCAFNGTSCYERKDFTCHGDERDGDDVVFILIEG